MLGVDLLVGVNMKNVYFLFFIAALALLSKIVDVTETEAINLMQHTTLGVKKS